VQRGFHGCPTLQVGKTEEEEVEADEEEEEWFHGTYQLS
jgi:hypothetical protein